MFGFIKQYKKRRERKSILKDIKKAKDIYDSGMAIGMCHSFVNVNFDRYYNNIQQIIPEFKPETFNLGPKSRGFWWLIEDRESRIKAFDKLIEIYSK